MVQRVPITKARVNLGQIAKRAHVHGEYFILEKDGIPVIGIMDADELEDYLDLRDPRVRKRLEKSHRDYVAGRHHDARGFLAQLQAGRKSALKRRRSA